jgi:hypothetical protein
VRLTWNGLLFGLGIVPVTCALAALAACGGGYGGGGGTMAAAPTINLAVQFKQFAGIGNRLADAIGETFRAHPVLHCQHALLELLALVLV